MFQPSYVHWNRSLFHLKLENFMTSVLGRSVKLVGETIVGPNLWGLWSADLRPNLISPLFAPAAKFNTFPLQREDARFLLLNKIKRNLIISFPEEGGDIWKYATEEKKFCGNVILSKFANKLSVTSLAKYAIILCKLHPVREKIFIYVLHDTLE